MDCSKLQISATSKLQACFIASTSSVKCLIYARAGAASPRRWWVLATYTAAWLFVTLLGDRGAWSDLVFGAGNTSLCNHAPMVSCYARPPSQ